MGSRAKLQKLGNFRKFFVKSNLAVCKVTFDCKLQKKIRGAGYTSCSPDDFVVGATAPLLPLFLRLCMFRKT